MMIGKDWESKISYVINKGDSVSDKIKYRLNRILDHGGPFSIISYLGYGGRGKLFLNGRVIKTYTISNDTNTALENLLNLYKRFETDEIPDARVRARFRGVEQEAVTDDEGYFNLEIESALPLNDRLWHEVELELLQQKPEDGHDIKSIAQVLVPPPGAKFGVISDIDDTVIVTNVTDKLMMVLTVALLDERTRLPFKGVSGFYRALQNGKSGSDGNPIFYVSSSPWNLYEPLIEFMKIHNIPLGPVFLKDWGDHSIFSLSSHHEHKMGKIRAVLDLYRDLPFILIGDSGEQDPEIYRKVVKEYPSRIRVIYIRNINPDPERVAAVDKLIEEVRQTGCQLVLAPDSEFAAAHAAGEGLILTDALSSVRSEKETDENAPTPKEIVTE